MLPRVALAALTPLALVAAQPSPRVTFTKDVAPIVWSRCAPCHRPGEIGPFSLVSYDDVRRRVSAIDTMVAARLMPPWKPLPGKGDFADARRLSDYELHLLRQWIADGAPEGNRADLPPQPAWNTTWRLGEPDLVVSMPAPYALRADGGDVFRTFVVPIPIARTRYVRAIELRPDNARVVHHATLGIDRTRSSRQLDARDAEPGYTGGMVPDARYPEGQLLGWTPGQAPHATPPGLQWPLEPESDLVMQLHLQPTGKAETLTVRVGFYFTDDAPSRTPVGVRLGSETIDIAPGDRAYVVEDRYTVPVDVDLMAIQPHAHTLARRMEATATRPDGTAVPLIAIDDWDFRWQDVYRYAQPIALAKGTTIAMRYVYDNSAANVRNPHAPPARVVWGQNTTDEMGDLWLQLVPARAADLTALSQDVRRKAHVEDVAAYAKLLREDPENPLRHDAVAALAFDEGQVDQAIEHYRTSLRLNPSSASTHYNIGIAYSARGRRDEALTHFEQALRLDPAYAQAHNNAGGILYVMNRFPEAVEHFRRAIALRPDYLEARTNLGTLLSAMGRPAEAAPQFREALALRPDHAPALAGLAWIEATASDAALRREEDAVQLAERAADLTAHRDLSVLDALAAAYAAAGRFDRAVAVAEDAVRQATAAGRQDVAARFRDRLALYQQKRAYRMPPPR